MKPDRTTKVKAVYNSKFGQWRLCHDAWCKYGETSIVANLLTDLDGSDEAWAKEIERRFNLPPEVLEKAQKLIDQTQPHIVMGDDDSIHLTPQQQGFIEGVKAVMALLKGEAG